MSSVFHNLILVVLVGIGGFVLFSYACPWLDAIGHKYLCYGFFVVLIIVLFYARAGGAPKRGSE